jgi:hypothetical protein
MIFIYGSTSNRHAFSKAYTVNPSSLNLLSKTCESGSTSVRPGIVVGTPEQKGRGHVVLRAASENVF